jgi:uncharacterized lipoprotein YddW (UPF0748 family)
MYYDPGHPQAQEFVLQSIMETVKHYDLDAVHFDDYFYPYRIAKEEFPDSCSYADYGKSRFVNKDDWRRDNVDFFVRELSHRIKKEKPYLKFGISPFGVWRNIDKDSLGSRTQAGQTNYDDLYADVLKWLREGWIDYVTPQIYWHIGFEKAEYKTLVEWWNKNTFGRHVYIGQAAYRIGEKGWENPDEINNQVSFNRSVEGVQGSMYFSTKTFMQNKNGINQKMRSLYPHKALVPVMPWLDAGQVYAPVTENISGSQGGGITLTWKDSQPGASAYYVIYRCKDGTPANNPSDIVAIIPRLPSVLQSWTDKNAAKRTKYTYKVTAANRLHDESQSSNSYTIKTRGKKGSIK